MRCRREGRARDFRARGWWSAETIDRLVKERVSADPEGLALVDPPNTTALVGRDPVRWTWNRLDERVDVLAAFLLARGVRAGDVVAVQLPNCSALVQAFLAIVRIGAVVTPFPVSYREYELGPMCRRTGSVGVVTASRYGERELAGAALGLIGASAPSVRFVVASGDDEPAGALAWPEDPLSEAEKSALDSYLTEADVNDCVTICWTSGTEAEPKAVPRCHGDWLATARGCVQAALLSGPVDIPDPDQRASYFPHYASDVTWSTPVAGWTSVRLHDPVTGERVTEPGRPGELRIAGPTVFAGYLRELGEPLDTSPFDDDGHFRTGDVFEIAGERGEFLRYVDRTKDLVIRGGMNISPAEVEGLLAGHPDVADVGVVGVPDDVMGERVCAVVVPGPRKPTLEELVAYLRERKVAAFKLPERLEYADALPRNPVGKILKRQLRESLG